MMTFLKRLWRQRALLYFIIVPVILLPIALVDPQPKWQCAYVVALMACYWLPQVLPIAVTSLFPLILFPMFGILTSGDTAAIYMADSSLILLGGFVLAAAIEVWDIHRRIALRILLLVGSNPRWLMFGLMFSTWFLSMWITNTATTAMMIPITQAVLTQLKPKNDIDETLQTENGRSNVTGCQNRSKFRRAYQRMCKGMVLSITYAANVGGVATLTGTPSNVVAKGQTDLLFTKYDALSPVTYALWMAFSFPLSLILLLVTWLWLQVLFLPCTCRDKNSGDHGDVETKENVTSALRTEYESLGPTTFPQYCVLTLFVLLVVLWITRDLGGVGGWGLLFPARFVSDATAAITVSIFLFILPSRNPFRPLSSDVGQTTLLSWQQFNSKMSWGILLLMGGGFSIAKGCQVSGLSEWIGWMLGSLSHLSPTVTLFIVCFVMSAVTQITTNIAIVTLLLPVLTQLALATRVNPLYYMIPATLSASFAFLLPVATPSNAIVFTSGHVRVVDMVLAGLVLNILAVPLVIMATETWGTALFGLDVFPEYFGNVTLRNNGSVTM